MIEADYKFDDTKKAAEFTIAILTATPRIVMWYDGTGKLPVSITVRYKNDEEYAKMTEKTGVRAKLCVDFDKEDAFLFAGYDEDND